MERDATTEPAEQAQPETPVDYSLLIYNFDAEKLGGKGPGVREAYQERINKSAEQSFIGVVNWR